MINFSNGVKLSLFANSAEKEKIRVNVRFGHGYQAFSPGKPVPSWAGNYALMASGVGELGQDELDRLTTGRRIGMRSEERRVGKEGVCMGKSRGSPDH